MRAVKISPSDCFFLSFVFPDVLGVVTGVSEAVQYHSASRAEPSTKRIIHIKDQTLVTFFHVMVVLHPLFPMVICFTVYICSGSQLTVSLWGQTAIDFDGDGVMELGKTEPVIVIFVGTLVKSYDG